MLKRLLNHFRKKRSDALIHQARDAAARASALLAEAILSRDPQELLDEDDEEDKIRSEQRRGEFTEAARRLFPDARTPVELAFAEALAARIAGGVRLPARYLFEDSTQSR
jgi:DNA-directed RNA polymerase specialized sigma24 family protein